MPSDVREMQQAEEAREALKADVVDIGDMRQGSLVETYRKCGKPNCHCARQGDRGHGPVWLLTRAVRGKTVTRLIPPSVVEQTRAQIAEYRRFRELTRELVEVNERLCNARLQAGQNEGTSDVKKKASKTSLKPKSPKKSKS